VFNSIDVDLNWFNRELFDPKRVVKKIRTCPHLTALWFKYSQSLNGYHIELYCEKECDKCRLVFDHQRRYFKDLMRPEFSRNVLFEWKRGLEFEELEKIRSKP